MTEKPTAGWYANPDGAGSRYWDGSAWTEQYRDAEEGASEEEIEVSRAGIVLGAIGAATVLVSVFLPHLESDTFFKVVDNTMIQNDLGWGPIIVAVLSAGMLFSVWNNPRRSYALLVLGALAVAYAIYAGTGERVELTSVGPGSGRFGVTDTASAGVGVYVCGIGGALLMLGGALLAGWNWEGAGASGPAKRRTKQCPDCAEAVLVEARVCKHCGHQFDGGDPASPA